MATPTRQGYLMGTAPNQFTYTGLTVDYTDIASLIGVVAISPSNPAPAGISNLGLRAALKYGKGVHVSLSYVNGDGKKKRSKILIPVDHIGAALGLVGSSYKGGNITGAVIPEHLTFG